MALTVKTGKMTETKFLRIACRYFFHPAKACGLTSMYSLQRARYPLCRRSLGLSRNSTSCGIDLSCKEAGYATFISLLCFIGDSKQVPDMNKPISVEGLAHLCFLPNGRFMGRVVSDTQQFSLVGGSDYCMGPDDHADHKCCYEENCKLRNITVTDYEGFGESTVIPRVLQSGGDNCTLSSSNLKFVTDQLITGAKAEEYIEKFFSHELLGKDCLICIGNMKISYPDPLDAEDAEKE